MAIFFSIFFLLSLSLSPCQKNERDENFVGEKNRNICGEIAIDDRNGS